MCIRDSLVSGGEEFGYGGRADPTGGSGDENTHGIIPFQVMSVTDIDDSTDVSCCHH